MAKLLNNPLYGIRGKNKPSNQVQDSRHQLPYSLLFPEKIYTESMKDKKNSTKQKIGKSKHPLVKQRFRPKPMGGHANQHQVATLTNQVPSHLDQPNSNCNKPLLITHQSNAMLSSFKDNKSQLRLTLVILLNSFTADSTSILSVLTRKNRDFGTSTRERRLSITYI